MTIAMVVLCVVQLCKCNVITLPSHGTPCRSTMEKVLQNQRVHKNGWGAMSDENIEEHVSRWFDFLLPTLPPRDSAPKIVDIGCGLGMYHIPMHNYFERRSNHFLVDQSKYEIGQKGFSQHSQHGGFHSVQKMPFYTSEACASKIAMASGFTDSTWHWVNATVRNVRKLGTADIVMSYLSWGFHYPVEVYADAVHHLLQKGGRLIITVRLRNKQEQALKNAGFECLEKNRHGGHHALLVCTAVKTAV